VLLSYVFKLLQTNQNLEKTIRVLIILKISVIFSLSVKYSPWLKNLSLKEDGGYLTTKTGSMAPCTLIRKKEPG